MRKTVVTIAALAGIGLWAGAAAAAGDPEAGEKSFNKCKACHTLDAGKHRVGPSLANVIGRQSGQAEGFKYSDAMKKANITWTPENLDKYLANPKEFVPGNKMVFAGISDPQERQNIVAYLQKESGHKSGAADSDERNGQTAATPESTEGETERKDAPRPAK